MTFIYFLDFNQVSDHCWLIINFEFLAAGCVPSPFDCFLANRGLKTLHVRMKQHQENATAIAKYLEASPRIKRVIYPGSFLKANVIMFKEVER